MEPRISIVTLGVDDLDRAAAFYEAMGLERHEKITDGVAFFQMGGLILALWPREELARDAGFDYEKPTAAQVEKNRAEPRLVCVELVDPGGRIHPEAGNQDQRFALPVFLIVQLETARLKKRHSCPALQL